jgi:hypothetical protein
LKTGRGRKAWWAQTPGLEAVLGDAAIAGLFLRSLESSFLLSRREGPIQLPVYEKVVQNTAWTPGDTVGPPLNTGRMLLVDKDVATLDQVGSLLIMRSARDMMQSASQTCLKDEKGVQRVGNVALVGWLEIVVCLMGHD